MIQVDPEDIWLLEELIWRIHPGGYVITSLPSTKYGRDNRHVMLHHMIVGCPIWEGEEVDHINHDKQDNRRSNLRIVTKSQNQLNGTQPLGMLGTRHIYLREDGQYYVRIVRQRKEVYLGKFSTLDEATAERDEWLDQHKEYVS